MIILPTSPGARRVTPFVLDFGGILVPDSGAATQRINRLGNRYGATFEMPPLKNADEGRIWINRLVRGQREGARMEYPLLDFKPGTPGNFVVDGNGQTGSTLVIRGGTPHYIFREGQPFSLEIAGQHYLDFVAGQVIADASGEVEITLTQMLRAQPSDGDALHLTQPMIEGWVVGDRLSWELALERTVGLSFEMHEAR